MRRSPGSDGCFHLAAVASVELSNRDWLGAHRTNLTGAITVFEAATAAGPIPVVYASSAAVYGDCPSLPLGEKSEKRPLSAYGADKIGCELHARVGGKVHRLPSVGLRLFNVYGPGQDPKSPYSGVISIFCERLRRGEPIEIFGDGDQTRDFIFVADVVAAMLRAMDARLPAPPCSMSAAAAHLGSGTGANHREPLWQRPGDPFRTRAQRRRQALLWRPDRRAPGARAGNLPDSPPGSRRPWIGCGEPDG